MELGFLKKIRVAVSLLFFFVILLLFLDFGNAIDSSVHSTALYLQFIPSALSFVEITGIAAAGFLFVIILTLLFGRAYCSSICPLGTYQDIVSNISRRTKKKRFRRFEYKPPHNVVRYSILAVIVLSLFTGSITLVYLLDPYSVFGRISGAFVRPVVIGVNNVVASVLESFEIYAVYPHDLKGWTLLKAVIPFALFAGVTTLAWKHGRLYCNTLCPVGTLLGLLSRFSIFKIAIKEENCTSCGLCARECKANCIDAAAHTIDFDRCVSCFNCFTACNSTGLTYRFTKITKPAKSLPGNKSKPPAAPDYRKREFIKSTALYALIFTAIGQAQNKIVPKLPSRIQEPKIYPVTPPGSKSIEHFNEHCTACQLCVSACPTQVLQPSYLHYGFTGMLQPHLDAWTNFCNYECIVCTEVCPTGAILPLTVEEKKLTQVGKAVFIEDNCIVISENTACGACAEHCPTKAVYMVPYEGSEKNITKPELNNHTCIGCAACEYACPTRPYKAIYVNGNEVHELAEKPKSEKLEAPDPEEDFPF